MLITMSAVLLLGLLIWFLLRIRYLRLPDVLISGLFGFLLAKTSAAPVVQTVIDTVSGLLAQLRFWPTRPKEGKGAMPPDITTGSRRGAKSPNPTPSGTHSIRHVCSERSRHPLSTRKHPRPLMCELRDGERPMCDGREQVVLVGLDGTEQRLCPAHAAALWLTDPTLRFSAKTRPQAIAAVMGQAFGGPR
ncbi:hypothetical protein ACFYT4_01285 [Streptomyces sp. NPDC004609]|uniref:hypothetical protein n=1 Tax=Streptomyces sp. NPDC004609 TaxID=3364704 RepID=UPI0036D0B810